MLVHGRALRRGAISRRQRRALKARIRHHRALRERARLIQAVAERRPLPAASRAARAVAFGSIDFLGTPSRWREWLSGLLPHRR